MYEASRSVCLHLVHRPLRLRVGTNHGLSADGPIIRSYLNRNMDRCFRLRFSLFRFPCQDDCAIDD